MKRSLRRAPRQAGRKAVKPVDARALIKRLQAAKFGDKRARRTGLQRCNELQILSAARGVTRTVRVIGGILVLGLDQLDPAPVIGKPADKAGRFKMAVGRADNIGRAGAEAEAQRDFVLRWYHAMIAEMGLEDFERYNSAEIERHGATNLTGGS